MEISENLLESLSADLSEDLLKIRKNIFLEKEIGKAFLVVAATSNRKENHHIAEICHAYNVLVNVADSEEESSFIFPSVVRKGDISIGINSGTGSPTVSKHIRKQIEKAVPDYYADIAGKLHIHFANASVWPVELGPDGVHMTVTGHQVFAEEMKKVLADIF